MTNVIIKVKINIRGVFVFELREKNGVKYLVIKEFEDTNLVNHCFSTRHGGVSTGEAASLNFGFTRKDSRENVLQNFRIICNTIDTDFESIVLTDQVHDNKVYVVTKKDAGKGILKESDIKETDALVTNEKGVTLVTFHADCIPVFFLDPITKSIGLAHSGWKGTYKNISAEVISKMKSEYGTNPADLMCGIGPSILKCHFEVGEDVAEMFREKYGEKHVISAENTKSAKPHIDLTGIVEEQLKNCGIKTIIQSNICTYCNNDMYYSYRGDDHKTGSLISMMALKEG